MVEGLVRHGRVDPPHARRPVRRIIDPIPTAERLAIRLWLLSREETHGKIVSEAFPHGRGLLGLAELRANSVLYCVSEFMQNDLGVLGVVDAAGAVHDAARVRTVFRVVFAGAAGVDGNRRVKEPARSTVTEIFEVAHGSIDV